MVGVVKTDEDCGDDGNVKECVANIDLKSKLTCYLDKKFKNVITKNKPLYSGDYAYCQMEFKDTTIRKYLHISTVMVKAGKEKLDVVPTGYY